MLWPSNFPVIPAVWNGKSAKATAARVALKSPGLAPCPVHLFRRPHPLVHDVLDILRLDRPAALVDQRDPELLAVRARPQTEMRLARGKPPVAPFGHREERQPELAAHPGQ